MGDGDLLLFLVAIFAMALSSFLIFPRFNRWSKKESSKRTRIVLVDMDGVVCDFESHALKEYQRLYPNEPIIPIEARSTFLMASQYGQQFGEESRRRVVEIIHSEGFFESLPPIAGSVEGVKLLASLPKVKVFFCSSPLTKYDYVLAEKYRWIEKHFGPEWTKRIILTRDKTLVKGDYLIDDKPKVEGAISNPDWEHVVFTATCNLDKNRCSITGEPVKRIKGWSTLESDLEDLF